MKRKIERQDHIHPHNLITNRGYHITKQTTKNVVCPPTITSTRREQWLCELTDLEDESIELRSSVSLLPLISVQWVHEPCDQLCGEDGGVRPVEVLEITQSIQPPKTQCVDETTQIVESAEEKNYYTQAISLWSQHQQVSTRGGKQVKGMNKQNGNQANGKNIWL